MFEVSGMKESKDADLLDASALLDGRNASKRRCSRKNEQSSNQDASILLFGREGEISILLQVFQRSLRSENESATSLHACHAPHHQQEFVLIKGASGTGKTTLAKTLRIKVDDHNGFFLSGKFALTGRQDPYAAFQAAFTQFIDAIILSTESGQSQNQNRLSQMRQAIQEAVAAEGQLLTDMIPPLERLIGKQQEVIKMSGSEALHRFQYVFCKFCHAISTVVPLVLFFDDLQWGDQASLDLLEDLLQTESRLWERGSLFIVASYRDDEDCIAEKSHKNYGEELSQETPFQKFIDKVRGFANSSSLRITEIKLGALNESSMNELVATTLELPSESTRKLSRLVFDKSRGNVFHAKQYLQSLLDGGIVSLDPTSRTIKWSDSDIQKLSAADDQSVDDLVRLKLANLPDFTQTMLQVASCIGDDLNFSTLSLVMDGNTDDISSSLDLGVQEHLLVYLPDQGQWSFSHDRIRFAAQSSIADFDAMCFQVGHKLWSRSSPIVLSASICTVASLINKGFHKMGSQMERHKVASLNLQAGEKASTVHSFPEAAQYFRTGITLLTTKDAACWHEEYNLTLKLYNAAADAELCNQDFSRVALLTSEILQKARSFDDKLAALIAQIYAAGQNGSLQEAINMGLDVVRQLGVDIPSHPSDFTIVKELMRTSVALFGKSDDTILSLPLMREEKTLSVVHIFNVIVLYAFQIGSPVLPLIATRLVQLSLKYGLSKGGAHGFVLYSFMVARFSKRQCYRFGRLALTIVEKLRARELIPCVHSVAYFQSNHWMHPVKESLGPLENCIQIALDIGEVEYACLTSIFWGVLAALSGLPLIQVQHFLMEACDRMARYKQSNFLQVVTPVLQATRALLSEDCPLTNTIQDFAVVDGQHKVASVHRCSWGAFLAYLIGDMVQAEMMVQKRLELKFDLCAEYSYAVDQFYRGLIAVARARSRVDRRSNTRISKRILYRLKSWAKDCPGNYLNKQQLLEAEIRSLQNRKTVCSATHSLYGRSYELASKEGFTQEAALACELAGNYVHGYHQSDLASEYWKKAHSLYVEWGGLAKASHLRQDKDDELKQKLDHKSDSSCLASL